MVVSQLGIWSPWGVGRPRHGRVLTWVSGTRGAHSGCTGQGLAGLIVGRPRCSSRAFTGCTLCPVVDTAAFHPITC